MRLGRFELLDKIAQGGEASVFRARAPDGVFAIKVIRTADPAALARFEREARLLARLGEAEGVVPFVAAGSMPEGRWLAMPFLENGTLRRRLQRSRRLPADEAVTLVARVARTLGRAHAFGVVHRDLKPENILFAADGRPLVADFGLAKDFAPGQARERLALSRTGDFRGTLGYMAPEQMLDSKSAGPPADVFSLGAILFECLAGERACPGASPVEIAGYTLEGRTRPIATLRPFAPAWVRAVVERALAREPGARFADGAALADALEKGAVRSPRRGAALVAGGLAVIALVAAVVVPRAVARARASEAHAALATALERERAQDDAGAAAAVERAVERGPDLVAAWALRARVRARRHDAKGAASDAARALALDERSVVAWCAAGVAREASHDVPGAIAAFTRAIELDASCASAWAGRARVECRVDDPRARPDAEKAVALAPRLAEARIARALERFAQSDFREALAEAAAALVEAPRAPLAMAIHGAASVWTGDERGRDECKAAIALDGADPFVWSCRGTSWFVNGRLDAGLADFTKALELDPDLLWPLVWRARMRHDAGDVAGALDDTRHAIRVAPRSARPWVSQADSHMSAHDLGAARDDIERALALDPRNVAAHMMKGIALMTAHDFDGAIAEADEMVRLEPENSQGYYMRASLRLMTHQLPAARADAERTIELARDVVRERNGRSLLQDIADAERAERENER